MIDATSPVGDLFFKMAGRLHDRRTGRVGARRWNRSLQRNQRGIRPPLELLHDYFVGDPQLNEVHQQWKAHVRQFIRMGRLNIAGMSITGSSNRMSLRGFRTAAANDETGDQEAHQLMVASGLPLASRDAIDSFLWAGDSYILCTPPGTRRPAPSATAEDPRQAITMDDPLTGLPRHGLKLFRSEWDDEDLAYLMIGYDPRQGLSGLEGKVLVARRKGSTSLVDRAFRVDAKGWEWDEELFQDVPGKVMPMHHLRNRSGAGEFEHHLDSLDRINDKVFGEWWTAKIQAFRQRAVENLPEVDEKGEDIDYTDMFTASPDEMWQVPADVKFWESTPVDLNPIINSIQKDLERVAGAMAIPLNQITPDAADGSAEGASLMREEHVYKIDDRIERVSPPLVRVMANLFGFAGQEDRADPAFIEAIFGPRERWSLAQRADAAAKLSGILPTEAIWTDVLQYEPHEVPALRVLRGRDRLAMPPPSSGGQPLNDPGRTPAGPLPSTPPAPRALPPGPTPVPPAPATGTR